MKILAIETSTEACSAAVLIDGAIVERYQVAPREHHRLILPMIGEVLAECGLSPGQLDAIAFGRGPGSFTGLRIAAGVTQGLALGLDLPVVPVSTLAALSLDAMLTESVDRAFACIDARMHEVYWGVYERLVDGDLQLLGVETVCPPESIQLTDMTTGVGVGSGWATYQDLLGERMAGGFSGVLPDRFPRAAVLARLGAITFLKGGGLPPEQAQPVYLRDNVAKKPGTRL
jgi:tRNA threonylcarbamoyladenosine biosynthesis protein TsaB